MTREQAIDKLMKEWRADEAFRPFFSRMVDDYMGEAKNVLAKDYENIKVMINKFR